MKKVLPLLFLITTSAFAVVIDSNTKIKWNSRVVTAALNTAGLQNSSGTYQDVALTYNRILEDLLARDTFSVTEAVSVCMQQCNKSTFLKEGRGQSGRKCPAVCEDFGNALINVNNEFTETGNLGTSKNGLVVHQADGTLKIYSADKKYYAICGGFNEQGEPNPSIKKYSNICSERSPGSICVSNGGVVFEAQTNKPIALMGWYCGDDSHLIDVCGVGRYDTFGFFFDADCGEEDELFVGDDYVGTFEEISSHMKEQETECRTVNPLSQTIINKYVNEIEYRKFYDATMQKVQECKDVISEWYSAGFTENTWHRYRELKDLYWHFRPWAPSEDIRELEEGIQNQIERIKQRLNGQKIYKKFLQFKKPEEAYEAAKNEMVYLLDGYKNYDRLIDKNKIKCSSEPCKHFGDDTVTCTIGDVTYYVVFDDICQSRLEEFLGR